MSTEQPQVIYKYFIEFTMTVPEILALSNKGSGISQILFSVSKTPNDYISEHCIMQQQEGANPGIILIVVAYIYIWKLKYTRHTDTT